MKLLYLPEFKEGPHSQSLVFKKREIMIILVCTGVR